MTQSKQCSVCATVKPLEDFSPVKNRRPGATKARCRACDNEYAKRYYRANRDKCIERTTEYAKTYYPQNRDRLLAEGKDKRAALRSAAIEVYGGCCVLCGSIEGLEFDHVNDDGAEHRKTEDGNSMVIRIARSGKPIEDFDLRLLCKPCHHPEAGPENWRGRQRRRFRRE